MKNTGFNKYLNKEKLKGNYTSKLDESLINEGIWDSIKKFSHDHITDGQDKIYYRIECDLTGKKIKEYFKDFIIKKLKREDKHSIEDEKINKTLNNSDIAKNLINEKLKTLLTELATGKYKGYQYPWIAGNKVYFYFDNEEHARRCYENNILQNEKINLDEDILKTIFSISKKTLNTKEVSKLKKSGGNVGSNTNIENFAYFLDKQTDEIYNAIKDNINDLAQKEGTTVVYRVTLKLTDDDYKKMLKPKEISNLESADAKAKALIEYYTKYITDDLGLAKDKDFIYISGTKQGNLIFNFTNEKAATRFSEEFMEDNDFGQVGNPTSKDIDKDMVEKRKNNENAPKAFTAKIEAVSKGDVDGAVQLLSFSLKPDEEIEKALADLNDPAKDIPALTIFESKFMAFGKKFDKIVLNEDKTNPKLRKKPNIKATVDTIGATEEKKPDASVEDSEEKVSAKPNNQQTNIAEIKEKIVRILIKAIDDLFKEKKITVEGPRVKKDGTIVYKFVNTSKERIEQIVDYISGRMTDEIKAFVNEPVNSQAKYKENL